MDYREQCVLQSAQNAIPGRIAIQTYILRHVADRLATQGLLKKLPSGSKCAHYTITEAGRARLKTLPGRLKPPEFHNVRPFPRKVPVVPVLPTSPTLGAVLNNRSPRPMDTPHQ